MDIATSLPVVPVRERIETAEEFNQIPGHVFPQSAYRNAQGHLEIGGVDTVDIVEQYGSPTFVLDADDFRSRARALADAFGGADKVHYASKAFLTRAVARWVEEEGLSLDVASVGELNLALRADFPAERITVHGNNKSLEFLRTAMSAGVGEIVADSMMELDRIALVAQQLGVEQKILVRVKPGVHVDTHEFIATSHEDQKFGFSLASGSAMEAVHKALSTPGIILTGLHAHVGSQVFDADGFVLAAQRLLGLWKEIIPLLDTQQAQEFHTLDLGGGYGIAYTQDQEALDIQAIAQSLLSQIDAHAQSMGITPPDIMVEPGRALIGPSMVTLYTVGTLKDVHTSDTTVRHYIAVDGGMSDNIRPALYQAEYDFRIANRELTGKLVSSRVVGSHCESGDILVNDSPLPDDIEQGDIAVIPATGAYCYSMSSRYNMMLRPPVIVVKDGQSSVMLRRETLDDVIALEGEEVLSDNTVAN